MTYPISPDYVKSWTTPRAISELIANALDEDPAAQVTYTDGVLTITDNGPGIPEEGLILGYSPKGDTSIGQFGEGAKIAALVLARADEIGAIHIETVGYGFTPTVETRNILDGIAPRRSATPPQVLVYTFTTSNRTRGTKVTIECPERTAVEATARFRHLSEPGYTPPTKTADVILTGPRGRIYIGGVLVSEHTRFKASYDFPLPTAKRAQNRDRTVIASDELTRLVTDALVDCADEQVISRFVDHVLDGGKLTEAENYFAQVKDARVKAAFRAVGDRTFEGRPVFFSTWAGDETALDLLDGDFELIRTSLDNNSHSALMALLGVEHARIATQTNAVRNVNRTKYMAVSRLRAAERRTLDAAVATVRSLFGAESIGEVKVYTEAGNPALSCAMGFYSSVNGTISVSRDILTDPTQTLATMLHEAAHLRAHRRGVEFHDRTRGFEGELTNMLAAAVTALTAARSGNDETQATEVPLLDETPQAPEPETTCATRAALADLLNDRLPAVLDARGVANDGQLSDSLALHRNYLRLLTKPRPVGWRRAKGSMAPAVVADYPKIQVIADAFGLDPAVTWLAHMLCEGPRFGRRDAEPTPGRWHSRIQTQVAHVVETLATGPYADVAGRVAALASGEQDSLGDVEEWTGFVLDLIAAERDRLALPARGPGDSDSAAAAT